MSRAIAPYLSPSLRNVTGPALRPGGLELTRSALARAGLAPGGRVLDLGCGPGLSLGCLAGEYGLACLGLDMEPRMLARGQGRQPRPGIHACRRQGHPPDRRLPLRGAGPECVASLMPKPKAVLEECFRVLAPGGKLILNDLYLRRPPAGGMDAALPGCLGGARGRAAWEDLIRDAGFQVLFWEDHSRHLRELTARLVWEHGSAAAFWVGWCGGSCLTAPPGRGPVPARIFSVGGPKTGGAGWMN